MQFRYTCVKIFRNETRSSRGEKKRPYKTLKQRRWHRVNSNYVFENYVSVKIENLELIKNQRSIDLRRRFFSVYVVFKIIMYKSIGCSGPRYTENHENTHTKMRCNIIKKARKHGQEKLRAFEYAIRWFFFFFQTGTV